MPDWLFWLLVGFAVIIGFCILNSMRKNRNFKKAVKQARPTTK